MKKTKTKKATSLKKTKAVAGKKNLKTGKNGKSKTPIYPIWTMPSYLDKKDHEDLKRFYELFTEGKFEVALNFASSLDTIVREEIPSDIWKKTGGKLTKQGEEDLKNITETEKEASSEPVSSEKEEIVIKEENAQQKPNKKATAVNFRSYIIKDDILQPFSIGDSELLEMKFETEQEFEQLVLVNSKVLFGQHALIIEDKKKIKDEYFPDKFLFDFRDAEKPRFYIIETVFSVLNFGYFYARLTHFFALFKTQSRMVGFHTRLCDILDLNKEQKDELQAMIGENMEIDEFLSIMIEKKPAILLIMDNLRSDLPLLQETYTDTWGKMVKPIVMKKFSSDEDIICIVSPAFDDIWKSEKNKKAEIIKSTEEDHLEILPERIRNIYHEIKTALLETDSSLEFNPKKHYISVRKNKNLAFFHLRRKNIDIVVMNPEEDTREQIKQHRIKTLPASVQKFWNGQCCTIVVENVDNLDEVIDLLKMVVTRT